jgi:hypothetical protein
VCMCRHYLVSFTSILFGPYLPLISIGRTVQVLRAQRDRGRGREGEGAREREGERSERASERARERERERYGHTSMVRRSFREGSLSTAHVHVNVRARTHTHSHTRGEGATGMYRGRIPAYLRMHVCVCVCVYLRERVPCDTHRLTAVMTWTPSMHSRTMGTVPYVAFLRSLGCCRMMRRVWMGMGCTGSAEHMHTLSGRWH